VPLPKGGLLAKLPTFIFRELAGSGDVLRWDVPPPARRYPNPGGV